MKHTKLSLLIASAAIAAVGTQFAGAVPTLTISDGFNSLVIVDEVAGDGNMGMPGIVSYNGPFAGWTLVVDVGTTKPALGSATSPSMDLVFLALDGNGTLTIEFTETGFGPVSGNFVANIGGTTYGSVTYTTLLDGNPLTSLGPYTGGSPLAFSGSTSGAGSQASSFSLTQIVSITHSGTGDITTGDAALDVPDGGTTLALLGGSLLGLGAVRRKLVKA